MFLLHRVFPFIFFPLVLFVLLPSFFINLHSCNQSIHLQAVHLILLLQLVGDLALLCGSSWISSWGVLPCSMSRLHMAPRISYQPGVLFLSSLCSAFDSFAGSDYFALFHDEGRVQLQYIVAGGYYNNIFNHLVLWRLNSKFGIASFSSCRVSSLRHTCCTRAVPCRGRRSY